MGGQSARVRAKGGRVGCMLMRFLVGQKRPAGRNLGRRTRSRKQLLQNNKARKRQLTVAAGVGFATKWVQGRWEVDPGM